MNRVERRVKTAFQHLRNLNYDAVVFAEEE